jgi:signal peptidase I
MRERRPLPNGRTHARRRRAPAKARTGAARSKGPLREWLKSVVVGLAFFILLRTVLVQTFTIISGSMEGTLLIGDFLVLNKAAYGAVVPGTGVRLPGYDEPQRGDIVVFRRPSERMDLVKRLVGLPGDTLAMRAGTLYVDGVAQAEPYVRLDNATRDIADPAMRWQREYLTDAAAAQPYHPTRDDWGPIVVPRDMYFMLGDNRDESLDSRYWGFVPRARLRGRAVALYFSYAPHPATRRLPIVGRIRWQRIGDLLD